MPLNDAATLVVGAGNYFLADVGSALPSDILSPTAPWYNIGHTSLEEFFTPESEGGEATTLGTLQNRTLRTVYSTRTETFKVVLQQFDTDSLKLHYGRNAETVDGGLIGVPESGRPTDKAFLSVFVDGENYFAIYAPKVEVYRSDNMSLGDGQTLAGLPISIKPMKYSANRWTFAVTPLGDMTVEPTSAIAGMPGAFEPANATIPINLAELVALGVAADPVAAWTAGQYIVLGDSSTAYWNGSAWTAGIVPGVDAETAVAGEPGFYEPAGAEMPSDLAALTSLSVVASPSSAWAAGQYVELADASTAYWDGTAWAAGIAA
jgi:hypothetical protein